MLSMPTSEELNAHDAHEGQPDVAERPLEDEAWPDEAVECHVCKMWLKGPEAYNLHARGNRHRKNSRRQLAMERGVPGLGIGYENA